MSSLPIVLALLAIMLTISGEAYLTRQAIRGEPKVLPYFTMLIIVGLACGAIASAK